MIEITYMGNQPRLLNPDLIEYIESVPETMLVMVTGHRYMVAETPDTIVERIVEFRRRYFRNTVVPGVAVRRGTPLADCEG